LMPYFVGSIIYLSICIAGILFTDKKGEGL